MRAKKATPLNSSPAPATWLRAQKTSQLCIWVIYDSYTTKNIANRARLPWHRNMTVFFQLGKPVFSEKDDFFKKQIRRGWGGHFRSKKNCYNLFALDCCNLVCVWMNFQKNRNIVSWKRGRGGGVKGRSEIFRKFIHFWEDGLPLSLFVNICLTQGNQS